MSSLLQRVVMLHLLFVAVIIGPLQVVHCSSQEFSEVDDNDSVLSVAATDGPYVKTSHCKVGVLIDSN